jgi:hypothetical protein
VAAGRVGRIVRECRGVAAGLLGVALLGAAGCSGGGSAPLATPQISVTGGGQVRLGSTAQLTARATASSSAAVTWQVNGVAGGSATVGTISATGLYTPPAAIPSPNTVTITAVSQTVPGLSGSAGEAILNPIPVVTSAQATETVADGTSYTLDILGSGFLSTSVVQVSGATVPSTLVSATELRSTGTVTISSGMTTVLVVVNPDPGTMTVTSTVQVVSLKASLPAAARLLDQATFGPTLNDINHVQAVGLNAYLTEQFAVPTTSLPDIATPAPTVCTSNLVPCEQSEWWQTVLTGNDQLRQRVAFAWSEIFVVSTNSVNARARALALPQTGTGSLIQLAQAPNFSLNPNLPEIATLFDSKVAALVTNVGTLVAPITKAQYHSGAAVPTNLFSHPDQQLEWQNAAQSGSTQTGWAGRIADSLSASYNPGGQVPMITSVAGDTLFCNGAASTPVSVSPGNLGGANCSEGAAECAAQQATAQALLQFDSGLSLVQADNTITSNAYNYAKVLTAATASVSQLQTVFPANNALASQLKQIAQILQVRAALGYRGRTSSAGLGTSIRTRAS